MKEIASSISQLSPAKRRLLQKLLQETLVTDSVAPSQVIPARPEQETMVCSFSQEQLWLLDQLDPGNISYNISFANRLEGPLHLAALERSFQEVVRRHEALRTTFVNEEGQPRPVLANSLYIPFPLVDLQQICGDERENVVGQLLRLEARKPFDLACGPLLRVLLLRLGATDHVFLLVMHHIISDGWSMKVLAQELTTLYNAFASEKPSPLPELTLQYADFASWQRDYLQGDMLNSQLTYWARQLSGVVPLELPTDHPRPMLQTFNGAHQLLPLPQSLYDELRALSRREGVTLFMVLLAALQTWLYRYTGQADIAIGTPIANRSQPAVEGLIGFFLNTLVMRADLSGSPRFTELLKRVSQVTQEAFAHQDIPFAKLVAELQPTRSLSHAPFFQVVFILQDTSIVDIHLALNNLTQSLFPIESGTSQADLTFQMLQTGQGLAAYVEYNTDLFEADTIARMLGHWQTLLEGIVAAPEQTITTLPLLSAEERQHLLSEGTGPLRPLPAGMTVHEAIEAQAQRTPDALALVCGEQAISYHMLDAQANALAGRLQRHGVQAETLVAVLAERGLALVISVLAIWKAGGAFLPLDPQQPAVRWQQVMQQSAAALVLSSSPFLPHLEPVCQQVELPVLLLPDLLKQQTPEGEPYRRWHWHGHQLAYVISTSGSTGQPKGVMVEQAGMCNHMLGKLADIGFVPGEHLAQTGPQSFDIFLWQALAPLLMGGRVEIFPDEVALQPSWLLQQLQERAISHVQLVPAFLRALVQQVSQFLQEGQEPPTLRDLRWVIPTGDALPSQVARDWWQSYPQIPLLNSYGSTECSDDQCHYALSGPEQLAQQGAIVALGSPIANLRSYVLDRAWRLLPVGAVGELALGGVGVGRGYVGDPVRTAQVFVPDPYGSEPGGRLYLTGDRVRRGADGSVQFLGRGDGLVKLRGYRIELGEIEAVLRQHERVQEAVVVLSEEEGEAGELVAYVVGSEPGEELVTQLSRYLRERLPEYQIPSGWVQLERLPLSSHGKIDRRRLPRPQRAGGQRQQERGIASPLEEVLRTIWQQVLGREQIGVRENFFALGGHSLLATQLVSRVRALLQVELPLRSLFEAPTIAQQARQIERQRRQQQGGELPPELVARERPEEVPLSFAQQRLWFLEQLEPGNIAYNISGGICLTGHLLSVVLERCLQEIVRRHESLRTTFEEKGKQVVQVIAAEPQFRLLRVDLRGLVRETQEREIERLVQQEARNPFDLKKGPLLRAMLLQWSSQEYQLQVSLHHIIADGWSIEVLIRELATLYQAYVAGEPSPLAPLALQYADFALWQRNWLQGEVLEDHLSYWRKQLAQVPALELPTDHPRPAVLISEGASQVVHLSSFLQQKLQALSQREGATLFMVLLAAFQVLLARYSGQSDLAIGTPIANRNHSEIEGLIGFFVNALVIRTDLSDNPAFTRLLARVREVTLGAYAHQDLPFEKLVEVLQPQRDLSRSPLFQVMFILQNVPREAQTLPGLQISRQRVEHRTSKFDLTLEVTPHATGLRCEVEYNRALFEPARIERFLTHWQVLLHSIVAAPARRVADLPLLSAQEREQLLLEWNATWREEAPQASLSHWVEQQVQQTPDAVAAVYEDQCLTYAGLNEIANQVAHHLQGLGIGAEKLVGVCLERSLELVVSLLAILKAGGAYVPLDPSYPRERLSYMLQDAQTPVVLTHSRLQERCPGQEQVTFLCLDREWSMLRGALTTNPMGAMYGEQLAYMIYTSGSTGQPKGAMNAHHGIVNRLLWMQDRYQLTPTDRVLQKTPYSFDVSVWEFFWPLLTGARLVLARPGGHQDPIYLKELICEQAITTLHFVPAMLQIFLQQAQLERCESVRQVMCSGEALSKDLQDRFFGSGLGRARLHNLYGPTEAAIDVSFWECQPEEVRTSVPIGRPIANIALHVLDSWLQPAPIGVVGELYIAGVGVARGYHRKADLTAERFVPHPYSQHPGARMYRTGDLAYYRADGAIEYVGRIDSQVKIRGIRMELGEIESALYAHPAIQESVVVVREHATNGKQLIAYLVPALDTQQSDSNTTSWEEEHVEQWQMLYNDLYRTPTELEDPTLNIVGWNSSYTGQPLAAEEMREQVEQAVSRILARKPQHVIEIGCGTGMLLFRIAPHTRSYVASDLSKDALHYIEQVLATQALPQVRLLHQAAHETTRTLRETFDTVILNSTVQYFPGMSYLRQVLTEAFALLAPGGLLFVGDVRNLALHKAYSASVEFYKAAPTLSKEALRQRVQQRMLDEEELLVDPTFFQLLQQFLPQIGQVQIFLKRGRALNEMTRFRYDVLMRKEAAEVTEQASLCWTWGQEVESLAQLQAYLQERLPKGLQLRGVPNSRLEDDVRVVRWVFGEQGAQTVGAFREELDAKRGSGLDPEALWELGEQLGYRVDISWSAAEDGGVFDVSFQMDAPALICSGEPVSSSAGELLPNHVWSKYVNNPLQGKITRWILPQLREFLKERLPDYMIPAHFVALEYLPLSVNGKLDREALPEPEEHQLSRQQSGFIAPQTAIQEKLAALWTELLLWPQVSITDNFFELGGHSLLATQLVARIRQNLDVELPLRTIFEVPTIIELAQRIEACQQTSVSNKISPLIAVERPNLVPLSFAQQRLWFLEQLEPGSVAYLISGNWHLAGSLDVNALRRSLRELIKRHESLRTTFQMCEGQPVQVIHGQSPCALPVVDLSTLAPSAREREAQLLMRQESGRPFDLTRGPLVRSMLLRWSLQEHLLLLTLHHIIADGWSELVLVRELSTLYQAYVAGEPSPLAPLALQYADFALWQRGWLQGEVLEDHLAYWRKQLAQVPALELPTDHPRPAVQSFEGAAQSMYLSSQLQQEIQALGQREGVTLFMVLLATFQVLLARYSGQSDFAIGTPIANRTHSQLEGLIGFFVNTLVLRADLSDNPTFTELLARVREVTLGAYAHQDLPFEKLVEVLQPQRDLSRSPLFQVMFILQNTPQATETLPGLRISELSTEHRTAKFDLTLEISPEQDGLECRVEYNRALFEPARIERFLTHWQALLHGIVAAPACRVADLPLLSTQEREQLLVEWNATQTPEPVTSNLIERLEQQVSCTPDAIAVVYEEQCLTYAQLNRRANQLAHYLRALGVGPDQLVGVALERSLWLPIAVLGILKAGGAYVPLDPAYPQARLAFMLEEAQVAVLLTQEALLTGLPCQETQVVCLDTGWETIAAGSSQNPVCAVIAANLAYILYTSGSTGRPKGVSMNHGSLWNLLAWQLQDAKLVNGPRTLQFASLSFDVSFQEIFSTWCSGGALVLLAEDIRRDAVALLRFVTNEAITNMFLPFIALHQLAEVAQTYELVPPHLSTIITAGEQLQINPQILYLLHRLEDCTLHNQYGPTESHVVTAFTLTGCPDDWPVLPPIGRPIANTQIYLLDKHLQPVPVGTIGDLYIGGAGLSRGYRNQPQLTAERFVPHPFSTQPGQRLYKTGDLARHLPDGTIAFLGRRDTQVKVRGFRIELEEIETALAEHPLIRETAVVEQQDAQGAKRLVAYIVPVSMPEAEEQQVSSDTTASEDGSDQTRQQDGYTASQFRQHLKQKLPDYMLPASYVLIDKLPLTPSGKLDRRTLSQVNNAHLELASPYVAPQTEIERVIASIWQELLQRENIGAEENFFELGGHSLLATRVMSRLRELLKVELPLRTLFEAPTVAELARQVELSLGSRPLFQMPPLQAVSRERALPLSFAQQRLWFLDQLEPGNAAYLIAGGWHLDGVLDLKALQGSLQELVNRHESLRTTFQMREGQPVQVIHPLQTVWAPVVDLSALAGPAREQQVQQLAAQATRQPCQLEQGPLLRALVLRITLQQHILLLSVHHIVADGWSIEVLVQELTTLYQAFAAGELSPLAPLPIQYADFAFWQQEWLRGDVLARLADYWQRQLADIPPLLTLPISKPRPQVQSGEGKNYRSTLPSVLVNDLKQLGRQANVTVFTTFLAAFTLLLHYYSKQQDIVVGTDVANRLHPKTEGLIGFFVNQLVLRTDLSGDPSFEEALQRVRKITLDAYTHQDMPFEHLVQLLNPVRSNSYSPLFQVKIVSVDLQKQQFSLPALTVRPVNIEQHTSKLDITLFLLDDGQEMTTVWQYQPDLFSEEAIAGLAQHYQALLASIVAHPQERLSKLQRITEVERRKQTVKTQPTQQGPKRMQSLKSVTPKMVSYLPEEFVKVTPFAPDSSLPLLIQPNKEDIHLAEWARSNREYLEKELLQHGAILFRGFGIDTPPVFERFALAFTDQLFNENGEHPRVSVSGNVYTPVFYPPESHLLWHNENSFNQRGPLKIWFACARPADQGGETPLVDSRKVFERIEPKIWERFLQKNIMYMRNYSDELGLNWQEVFRTTDKAEVEARCRAEAMEFEWRGKDRNQLKTWCVRPAILRHPKTGALSWFNQAQHWHPACLDPETRSAMSSLFKEEDFPRNCYYGDGTPIEDSIMEEICRVYRELEVSFPWQRGDVVMLDNILTAHARNPFQGERKILVAMGEMVDYTAYQA